MINADQPLVTVAIPVFNAEAFIRETLLSVVSQDYQNLDILLIDNASTDHSWEIIQSFQDERIRALKNDENIGAEGNFNRCLELAKGKYFLLLPADDLLTRDSITKRVAVLEEDDGNQLALCFCARDLINADSKRIMTVSFCRPGTIRRSELLKKNVLKGMNVIGEPQAGLLRLEHGRKAGPYDISLPYVIDLDFWIRLLAFGDAYYIDEPLCAFRISPDNWSSRLTGQRYENYRAIIDKIAALDYSGVTGWQRRRGIIRAWLNEYMRRIFYRLIDWRFR